MLRMRNLLALAAAALSLTAALMAPVQANPNSNNNSGSYNNTNWCDAWTGCQYSCNIGGFKGKLVIDHAYLEGGYQNAQYRRVFGGGNDVDRDDDSVYIRPSLAFELSRWAEAGIFYLYRRNDSNLHLSSFTNNQLGVKINVLF